MDQSPEATMPVDSLVTLPPSDEPLNEDPENLEVLNEPINPKRERFPFCIVWGPLPCITWLFPFIGHLGICDSEGRVHDFAGPYFIGVDQFMTGLVCRYFRFDPLRFKRTTTPSRPFREVWDKGIQRADADFRKQMHNLCCNNCHHHVACAIRYMGFECSMIRAWWMCMWHGRWVSGGRMIRAYLGFFVVVAIVLAISLPLSL